MVCRPQACPLARSAADQSIGCQSGANTSRAPGLSSSIRLPAGLPDVEEEALLDGVLVRPGLDVMPCSRARSAARMMSSRLSTANGRWCSRPDVPVLSSGPDDVVALVGERRPAAGDAVVQHDLLGDHPAEGVDGEVAVGDGVDGEVVDVVDPPHAHPAAGIGLRLVLQRRLEVAGRPVPLGLVVDAHLVAVGVGEDVDRAVARVAVLPSRCRARSPRSRRPGARSASGVLARKLVRPTPRLRGAVSLIVSCSRSRPTRAGTPSRRPSRSRSSRGSATKKSRHSSGLWVSSSTWARWAMSCSGGTDLLRVGACGSGPREGGAVEELAGGADDAGADTRGGVDRAVDDDVDQQVAGRVLDVDLRGVLRPVAR